MRTLIAHLAADVRHNGRGQIIVIFALALVVMIAMGGLILDGGAAFAHRREAQNAADLAALSGANAYLSTIDQAVVVASAAAVAAAKSTAAQNGYTDGSGGTTVDVSVDTSNGAAITVDISAAHGNNFATIVGMSTWTVSTTASARTGFPSGAQGAAPFIFNVDVFQSPSGKPNPQYSNPASPFSFGDGNGDVPNNPDDIAWTCYGTCSNVNTSLVRSMIDGSAPVDVDLDPSIDFRQYIGQHNNGNHTSLYENVNTYLSNVDVPVAIVDPNGNFVGWATFHVISADQNTKNIRGYFIQSFQNARLTISACALNDCPRYVGSYVLKLVD
jgi:Flp pilus assembly protein TadG